VEPGRPEDFKAPLLRSDQFYAYVVDGDLHEKATGSGDSIADLGGLTIAYAAYENPFGQARPGEDGFSPSSAFPRLDKSGGQ